MIFKELAIGDWFTHDSIENAVFIKVGLEEAYCISNFEGESVGCFIADSEEESGFEFCSRYTWDCKVNNAPFEDCLSMPMIDTNLFSDIKVGAIYKGLGETYYLKINTTSSVVIWSVNPKTIGQEYSRKANSKGTFHIVQTKKFEYPEEEFIIERT